MRNSGKGCECGEGVGLGVEDVVRLMVVWEVKVSGKFAGFVVGKVWVLILIWFLIGCVCLSKFLGFFEFLSFWDKVKI